MFIDKREAYKAWLEKKEREANDSAPAIYNERLPEYARVKHLTRQQAIHELLIKRVVEDVVREHIGAETYFGLVETAYRTIEENADLRELMDE